METPMSLTPSCRKTRTRSSTVSPATVRPEQDIVVRGTNQAGRTVACIEIDGEVRLDPNAVKD